MEENNSYPNAPQEELKTNEPSKGSISFIVKTLLVGVLCLFLMIPLMMITDLVNKRKRESENVKREITSRWGQEQNITTPILIIPYTPQEKYSKQSFLYILPRQLDVSATLDTELRHRSIYEVPVYTAHTVMKGEWHTDDIQLALKEISGSFDLERAKIVQAISDPLGYKDLVYISVNGEKCRMKSDNSIPMPIVNSSSFFEVTPEYQEDTQTYFFAGAQSTVFPIHLEESNQIISFESILDIAGSRSFGFLPTGLSSNIKISGNWANPSFQGSKLPEGHSITSTNFDAEWKTFFEDTFVGANEVASVSNNNLFVSFVNPADHYLQTERSIKYGILVIVLSILSVFLVELTMHRRGESINFLHYILSGLSLVLFYSLLLSFSEIIGFGWAYLVAGSMTVVLNYLYFGSVLRNKRYALLLGIIMSVLYLGVFILMQMKTFALLAGSLGLFFILAFVMFFSAKITKN